MRQAIRLVLCSLAAVTSPGAAQDMAELEVDHALTFEFETPHTDWAQPYVGGKTRVLFITDGRGTNPRECVELMQRFDIEAEAAFWAQIVDSSESHWHGGAVGETRIGALLEQSWDCFVSMGIPLERMSPEQQYRLVKQVTEGAGLVFVGESDSRVLKDKNLLREEAFLASPVIGPAYRVGQGRGVVIPNRARIDYHEGWEVEYDYWQEAFGRAVLWAASKEPSARIGLSMPETGIDREGPPQRAALSLSGVAGTAGTVLEIAFRKPASPPVVRRIERLPAPGEPLSIEIPTLPAGSWHLDARLLSDERVVTWATAPFTVESRRSLGDVTLVQSWGEVGDYIVGSVNVEGQGVQGEALQVRLLDRRRRVLAYKDLPIGVAPALFEFEIQPWMPMLVTVEAVVSQEGQEVCSAHRYFNVTKRNRDRFNFLIWDVPSGTLAPYAQASLARAGVTLQLRGGNPPPFVAAYDIAWVPYTTRIMTPKTPEGIMEPFCWNDATAVEEHVRRLAAQYEGARQHGVFVYSLGDEVDTRGCCLSEHCADAYRGYLAEQYGDLAALNASWGTQFTSWDEVGLSKEGDNEEANSLQEGNYPRWFDRQAFKSYNFVQFCRKYAAAYADIDPEAKTGFEGAGRFQDGDDLDLIVRSNEFWSPYPGTADEVVRSIAPRQMPRSNWMGYTKDADSLVSKYWRMVTLGMDAVWYWRWDCIGRFHGWLAPDLRPFPAVQDILEDTRIVREGLGDLLLQSQMQDDGIAVLYSYPSVFAHKLADGASFGGYEAAHVATHRLLRDRALQFSYVTDRMLRLGEFDGSKYRLLLLPRAEAIGEAEARVIRQFVEGGGTVIADVRPGIYDGHCRPRAQGILDDLFGARRTATGAAMTVEAPGDPLDKARVDGGISPTSGKAARQVAGAPALLVNQVGKGRAILLNLTMDSLRSAADKPAEGDTDEWLSGQFGDAKVVPQVTLSTPAGAPISGVSVVRWRSGENQLLALFREAGIGEEALVRLPQPMYVYDLRNDRALGKLSSFSTTIIPCRATFFALCPQEPGAAEVTVDALEATGGDVRTVRIIVPDAVGLQAYRVRVRTTRGELDWLEQNVLAGTQGGEFVIPVAYNDLPGDWTVEARELFTGQVTEAKLTVR